MLIGLILLALALTEFLLGLYFIFRYEKAQSTIWYGLFCIAVSIYVGANGIGYVTDLINVAERLGWVGGITLTIFFLPFSYSYPIPQRSVRELLPWIVWPFFIFVPNLLFTDAFLLDQAIRRYSQGYQTAQGDFFWFMILVFAVYWIWSIRNLIVRLSTSDGIHRTVLRFVLAGIGVSLLISVIFDIVIPVVTVARYGYVGSLFTSVWLGFTSYILVKK